MRFISAGGSGRNALAMRMLSSMCSGFGIVRLDGDVVQAIGAGFHFGKELDVLAVIDLDEGHGQSAIGFIQRKRLLEAEKVFVEPAGFLHVVDIQGDVCDTGDVGTRRGVGGRDICAGDGNRDDYVERRFHLLSGTYVHMIVNAARQGHAPLDVEMCKEEAV